MESETREVNATRVFEREAGLGISGSVKQNFFEFVKTDPSRQKDLKDLLNQIIPFLKGKLMDPQVFSEFAAVVYRELVGTPASRQQYDAWVVAMIEATNDLPLMGRYSREDITHDKHFGAIDPGYTLGKREIDTFTRKGLNPYQVEDFVKENAGIREMQANQISDIVEQMDELLGTNDKTNYFKGREAAIKAKWQFIITLLKAKMRDLTVTIISKRLVKSGKDVEYIDPSFAISTSEIAKLKASSAYWVTTDGVMPKSLYFSMDKNFAWGDTSLDVYAVYSINMSKVPIDYRTEYFKILNRSATLIHNKEIGGENRNLGASFNELWKLGECNVVTRVSSFKKNNFQWKFEIKPRTGIFDRLLKLPRPKLRFSDYTNTLDNDGLKDVYIANWNAMINERLNVTWIGSFVAIGGLAGMESTDSFVQQQTVFDSLYVGSYNMTSNDFETYLIYCHSLNRAYYGNKASLQENAALRIKKYLNRDNSQVKKIQHFVGV